MSNLEVNKLDQFNKSNSYHKSVFVLLQYGLSRIARCPPGGINGGRKAGT